MKKVINYFLLLMMAMLALNLQSCKDDDDEESGSIIGCWKHVSSAAFGQVQPATDEIYEFYDGQYLYGAKNEGKGWEVNRIKISIADGIVKDSEGGYFTYKIDGNQLKQSFYGGFVSITLTKAVLPNEVSEMIKAGKYSEYTSIYDGTGDFDDDDDWDWDD